MFFARAMTLNFSHLEGARCCDIEASMTSRRDHQAALSKYRKQPHAK